MSRELELVDAFVGLADTLVAGFDVADFLHDLLERSVELVDADAGGLLLNNAADGRLHFVAASSEQARLLELLQLQDEEGPALEAYRTGGSGLRTRSGRRALPLADVPGRRARPASARCAHCRYACANGRWGR
ncbi:hypothetical protein [Nocardiopsis halophila]|uniref:hypothetical protein n=1 Tax=Nocardiopsis halophila TaxID=141692 RepID=UPI000348CCC5|nr:hypothetical protein [Nocardiopsis halophila]